MPLTHYLFASVESQQIIGQKRRSIHESKAQCLLCRLSEKNRSVVMKKYKMGHDLNFLHLCFTKFSMNY